nr:glycoside hydrolase domain-containing protein [Actinacidiphila soli]
MGFAPRSPLYLLDMEAYSVTRARCTTPTLSFVRAWNRQVRAADYLPGFYAARTPASAAGNCTSTAPAWTPCGNRLGVVGVGVHPREVRTAPGLLLEGDPASGLAADPPDRARLIALSP